jgi:hypothetical protein
MQGAHAQVMERGKNSSKMHISRRFNLELAVRKVVLQFRAKGLVEKLPKSRLYRLCPQGYSICLVFLKLFERVYSPLTAGLLQPYRADSKLQHSKRTQVDRLSKDCRRSR